ncbi:MAG TPA: chlorite dismutase family protein [Pseudomonadales bacterium]|nr:chlorite dismutase family protein [Pseudomonadales bacterium]
MAEQRPSEAVSTDTVGWSVLHVFYRIDRARWRSFSDTTRTDAIEQFRGWLRGATAEEGLQLIPIAGIAKSDVNFMAVHPDPRRIQRLGQEIAATTFGTCLIPVYSFLSISEVSEYMSTPDDWAKQLVEQQKLDPASPEFAASMTSFAKRMAAYAEARVHPQLPDQFPTICFYPMSKARGETRNWYTLEFNERKKYMGGHASTGRRFADRVTQLITSSTGLDDWEWGVTLFARDLKSLRDVVYEMRFDPGSAIYGQFGSFYVGIRFLPDELAEVLKL